MMPLCAMPDGTQRLRQSTFSEIALYPVRPEINLRASAQRRINAVQYSSEFGWFIARLIGRRCVARRLYRRAFIALPNTQTGN
jgi:hypothetical protein